MTIEIVGFVAVGCLTATILPALINFASAVFRQGLERAVVPDRTAPPPPPLHDPWRTV